MATIILVMECLWISLHGRAQLIKHYITVPIVS